MALFITFATAPSNHTVDEVGAGEGVQHAAIELAAPPVRLLVESAKPAPVRAIEPFANHLPVRHSAPRGWKAADSMYPLSMKLDRELIDGQQRRVTRAY